MEVKLRCQNYELAVNYPLLGKNVFFSGIMWVFSFALHCTLEV